MRVRVRARVRVLLKEERRKKRLVAVVDMIAVVAAFAYGS